MWVCVCLPISFSLTHPVRICVCAIALNALLNEYKCSNQVFDFVFVYCKSGTKWNAAAEKQRNQPKTHEIRNEYTSNKWVGDANSNLNTNSIHKWIDVEHCSSVGATWCFVHDTLFSRRLKSFRRRRRCRQASIISILKIAIRMDANKRWMHHWMPYFNRWARWVFCACCVIEHTCRQFLLEIYGFLFSLSLLTFDVLSQALSFVHSMTFFLHQKGNISKFESGWFAGILQLNYNAFNWASSQPARQL